MKKLSSNQLKDIREKLPEVNKLLEGEEKSYNYLFVSTFDNWLTSDDFNTEIHIQESQELESRRKKFQDFIQELYELTPNYLWRYKRHKRFFIYPVKSIKYLENRCRIQNQNGETGKRYDILLPELGAVYSEEWDWTNIIWFRDKDKIEPLLKIAKKVGLNILEKNKNWA